MAVHWISAESALSAIEGISGEYAARLAICTHAFEGLLSAKARLLVMGDKRGTDVFVPKSFWWALGHEALKQNWSVGDFSTWIDQRISCSAIGVTFDLSGICEMLPSETRPLIARKLSVAGNPDWMTAQSARAFMYGELRAQPVAAGQLLVDQCRLGFVAARAVLMQQDDGNNPHTWSEEQREWDIPSWYWDGFTVAGSSQQNWERGLFSGKGSTPRGLSAMTLTGVHFARSSMDAMLPARVDATSDPLVQRAIGGRLPAQFWDDLWCAVWGQIYRGELLPKTQADIERAMLDWAAANEHELSESGAKPRARKLFAQYRSEGKN